jgi:hypothetical protein
MWGVRVVFAAVGMVTMCAGQVKDTYQVPRSHYDYYTQRQSLQDGASQLAGWRYPLTEVSITIY